MKELYIEATADTPEINFPLKGNYLIAGRSTLEDSDNLYKQVIYHLKEFELTKNDLIFDFKLDYYNTLSIRYLIRIFDVFMDIDKHSKLIINWYHFAIDEDVEEMGVDLKEIYTNLKIKLKTR